MADDSTVPNRGFSRRKRRDHRSNSMVDWADISPEAIRDAIRWVAKSGGALRFGYTRDQGAYAIGIYGEGDPYTEYAHSPQDVVELLIEIAGDYNEGGNNGSKIPVKGNR